MHELTTGLWNPWLAGVVLTMAAVLTLLTGFVALRKLKVAFGKGSPPYPLLATLIAGGAGMGAIVGTIAAMETAGPGALVWMWITTLVGMTLIYTEASLQSRVVSAWRPFIAQEFGRFGRALAGLFCVAAIAFAAALCCLQTQQAGALFDSMNVPAVAGSGILIALAVPFMFVRPLHRLLLFGLVPLGLALYVAAMVSIVFFDPFLAQLALGSAIHEAFAADKAMVGMAYGVLQATLAGQAGIGAAVLAQPEPGSPQQSARAALAPVVVNGLLVTSTALAVLVGSQEFGDAEPVAQPELIALEQPYATALEPNPKVGQTIVLPQDAGFEADKHYAMVMRSNPRGHNFAQFDPDNNAVIVPNWGITADTDTVVFRPEHPQLAQQAAWDVRVACNREEVETQAGNTMLRLTPKDPDLNLQQLVTKLDLSPKPAVVVGDFPFVGKVGEASRLDSPQTYLAMYEARDPERFDPKLHEVIRAGFRGPYADTPTPRPPLAFIANDDFAPEIGEHIKLLLRADPRGNAFVRLTPHGTFEAPPWEFLLEARTLVIRHKSDPSRDRSVSVRPRFTGHRIEFEPEDSALNFEQLAKEPDHGGFFIRVRDQAFVAEIHEDARVHARYKGRRTIIPLTAVSEPQGPVDPLPYTPHPAELLVAGMQGPYVAQDGIQRIASYAARRMPVAGGVMASLGAMLLALASLVVWSNFAWRSGRTLAGAWFGIPLRTAILAVALAATNMALATALDFTHLTMGLLAIASLLAIVLVGPYRSPAS